MNFYFLKFANQGDEKSVFVRINSNKPATIE
jgi:hypothetical protein